MLPPERAASSEVASMRPARRVGPRAEKGQKPGRKGAGWGGLAAAGGGRAQWQPQALTTMLRCLRRITLLLLS